MRRRLMLKSAAQTAPEHTYIAEATYNENCYVDANHVMHLLTDIYQGSTGISTPWMDLEGSITVNAGDTLVFTVTQTVRNYIYITLSGPDGNYPLGNLGAQNFTVTKTATFTGTVNKLGVSFGGGAGGMNAVNVKITKNGEEWLN